MGMLKKFFTGGLAALAIALSSNADAKAADYMRMRPVPQIEVEKEPSIKDPELDHDDFKFNPALEFFNKKEDDYQIKLGPLNFVGSTFGSSSELNYIIPKGVELRTDGVLWYNGLSFDVQNDNFLDKLMFYSSQKMVLPTTPLDSAAKDIFNLPELKSRRFANLTLSQWFQVYKMFYNKTHYTFDGKMFDTHAELSAKTDSFADVFSTLYFSRGKTLLKYDHSVGYNVRADGQFGIKGNFVYGDGIHLGLHPLEKYIGSTFDMFYYYQAIASITASENHQFSQQIKNGWIGLGMTYMEYVYSKNMERYKIGVKATMEQIEQLKLMDIGIKETMNNEISMGNSYLGYVYATQKFKDFWYYAMIGGRFKEENVISMYKLMDETIALDFFFKDETIKNVIEQRNIYRKSSAMLDFGVAAGMNMGDIVHPYIAATSYPYFRIKAGAFLTVPRLVANFSISDDEFTSKTSPRLEFFIPIVYTGEYTEALLDYFKESTIIDVSPLAAKYSYTENARRKAYSQLRGVFISGMADSEQASLSFILNNDNSTFFELGVTSKYEFDGLGMYSRLGYKNVGVRLHYSFRKDSKRENEGHHAGMSLVGDLGRYYLSFDMKGLWFKQPNYYMYTPLMLFNKEDKYVMMNFGFVW